MTVHRDRHREVQRRAGHPQGGPYDLLVLGGTAVTPGGAEAADGAPGSLGCEAARVLDATGKLVLPGGVDPHVHYSGEFHGVVGETQEHSAAAAAGGTTTILDFAFHEQGGRFRTVHEAVEAKRAESAGRMAVDYGLHATLCGNPSFEALEKIGDLVRGGIPTIKTFTTFELACDDGHRLGAMLATAEAGGMSVVHAEDDAIAAWLTRKYVREGKTHGGYVGETRGPLVEEAAVRRCLLLAERAGCPLYVLHMAAAGGVRALGDARARGVPVYGETLAAYLSFTGEVLFDDARRGLLWNVHPTIKGQADQDELWRALADGRLDVVASDHFAMSAADLVVLDPARRSTVRLDELHGSVDWCCWEGWELQGRVETTVLRGALLVEDGRFVGPRTGGRYLERRLTGAFSEP